MPEADLEERSLRIWGILTIEEAAMIPMPRPLEIASLRQVVEVRSRSRRRVL